MAYLVSVGIAFPQVGPHPEASYTLVGTVDAESIRKAAKVLNLKRWHGWKNIAGVDVATWRTAERKFYFLPFETDHIDKHLSEQVGHRTSMTVVQLRRIRKFTGPITGKDVWDKY